MDHRTLKYRCDVEISSTDLQRKFGEVIHRASWHDINFIITSHHRPEMALISIDRYNELLEKEQQLREYHLAEMLGATGT